jgi:hypothetical protein
LSRFWLIDFGKVLRFVYSLLTDLLQKVYRVSAPGERFVEKKQQSHIFFAMFFFPRTGRGEGRKTGHWAA